MQAQIIDLRTCFDPDLFCDTLNSQNEVSKFSMAAVCTNIENPQEGGICEIWADDSDVGAMNS